MSIQGKIILCADSDSLMRPWMMGLDGIDVESFEWVMPFSQADEAREFMASGADIDEAWIVSSNDIESVNLAAAIRKDNPMLAITLILSELSGSVLSRASSAGIKTVYTTYEFAERFALEVQRRKRLDEANSPGYDEVISTIRKGTSRRRRLKIPEVGPAESKLADIEKRGEATDIKATSVAGISKESSVANIGVELKVNANASTTETGFAKITRPPTPEDRNAYVVGVFSGSGGVGRSVLSAISALLCARRCPKVLLFDADLQFGDLTSIMGMKDALTIDDVLEDVAKVEDLAQKTYAGYPALIAAPKRPENSDELDRHLGDLLAQCAKHFDVIIVDTSTYWREGHAALLEMCDCALFLMDQRASSVRSVNHAVDLCKRMGIATNSFVYALNRCDKKALFSPLDIAGVMNGAHIYELKDGSVDVEESCGAGCAEELIDGGNALVASIKAMLADILPDTKKSKQVMKDFGNRSADKNAKETVAEPNVDQHRSIFKERRSSRRRSKYKETSVFARASRLGILGVGVNER